MIKTIEIAPDIYAEGLAQFLKDNDDFTSINYDGTVSYPLDRVIIDVDELAHLIKYYMHNK
jgi:hypothetical protein